MTDDRSRLEAYQEVIAPVGPHGRSKLYIPEKYRQLQPEPAYTPLARQLEEKLAPAVARLEKSGQVAVCRALARAIVVVRWAEVTVDQGRDGEADLRLFRAQAIVADARRLLEQFTTQGTTDRLVRQFWNFSQRASSQTTRSSSRR